MRPNFSLTQLSPPVLGKRRRPSAVTRFGFASLTFVLCLIPLMSFAKVNTGELAPDFTLLDQEGNSHTLSAYRGKTIVLEWTNPTCPFVEFHYKNDTMNKLSKANPNVVWLTINSSHFTTAEDNKKWARSENVKTVLADPSGQVGRSYEARTTPHMFVINPEGKVVYQGAIDDNPHMDQKVSVNYVKEALNALKAGKKVTVSETRPYGCSVKYAKKNAK